MYKDYVCNSQSGRIMAIDGSKVHLPRSSVADGYRPMQLRGERPVGTISCLMDVSHQIPVEVRWSESVNERALSLHHLSLLRGNDIVLFDRGYYSYDMFHQFSSRCNVLFRVRSNADAEVKAFVRRTAGVAEAQQPLIACRGGRVVKYTITSDETGERIPYFFITNTRSSLYSPALLSNLYRSRWQVEVGFKHLKSDLFLESWKTKSLFKQELDVRMLTWMASRISQERSPVQVSLKSMIQVHCVLLGSVDSWRNTSMNDMCEYLMNKMRREGGRRRLTNSEKREEILAVNRFLSFLSEEWIQTMMSRSLNVP